MSFTGKTRASRQQAVAADNSNAAMLEAANIQSAAGLQVATLQTEAALEAAQISANAGTAAAGMVAGATMHAANLSSQAAANSLAEQERQYDNATADLLPYKELGETFLPMIEDAATPEGYAARLSAIMDTDVFADLEQEGQRAASSALSQSGLSRSGAAAQAAADINSSTAIGLDNTLYGRQMNNVSIGQAAAARQAGVGQNYANAVTGIETGTASTIGNLTVNGASQQASFLTNAANASSNAVQQGAYYTGQGIMGSANASANYLTNSANLGVQNANQNAQAAADGTKNAISAIVTVASFFSDETMKKNMQPISQIANLTHYQWDWKDEFKDNPLAQMTTGFKAQEVQDKYPDCVIEVDGKLAVIYPILQQKLRARLAA